MSDGLKILREMGAQTIHSETHISRDYIQAMIHETFDGMQSVQFIGFISILEREYDIDLSDLKAKGELHFQDETAKKDNIFIASERKSSNAKIYIFLVVILLISALFLTSNFETQEKIDEVAQAENVVEKEKVIVVDDSNETNVTANTIKEEILAEVIEANLTTEEVVAEVISVIEPEVVVVRSLKILPKRKIWAGYIEIETNKKYQKIFKKEFSIDPSKNWLLLFGSGTARLEVNGEDVKFSSKQNMRFKYVDGVFTKITVTEFKSLNKGRKW